MHGFYADWGPSLLQVQGGQAGGDVGGVWLVLAAVAGSGFTTVGAVLSVYPAGRLEDKRAEREARRQKEQWRREDQIRKEEQQRTDAGERQRRRVDAYKEFVAVTSVVLVRGKRYEHLDLANIERAFLEVQMYGSVEVSHAAETLYRAAHALDEAIIQGEIAPSALTWNDEDVRRREELQESVLRAREEFWLAARGEAEEE